MNQKNTILLLVTTLCILVMAGCDLIKPAAPIIGIDQPIQSGDIQFSILDARIRNSYSIHYTMHYPPESTALLAVTANITGLDGPQTSLSWGTENLALLGPDGPQALVYATWNIIGEDIQYKSGGDFKYRYIFMFQVPLESDFLTYSLHLKDSQVIEVSSILITPQSPEKASKKSEESDETKAIPTEPSGENAAIGGGSQNTSSAYHTTIGGGFLNTASVAYGTVAGGRENQAVNLYTSVGGGYANLASGRDATIAGGSRNTAAQYHAVVGGGIRNQATASDTTIAGGSYNQATGLYASISGGTQNTASGFGAVVGGGAGNTASHDQATVSGGLGNAAGSNYAVITGGHGNTAQGAYSTVLGGSQNQVKGDYSLAAGRRSIVQPHHPGAFLFSDSLDFDFVSVAPNELGVRATGGVRFVTGVDGSGTPESGVTLTPGSGSWASLSDQNLKENFRAVDAHEILKLVADISVSEWNYTSQDPSIRHIGPVAQDFYAAFGIGDGPKTINSVDADGVSLAAIQGLYQVFTEKETQIQALEQRLDRMESRSRLQFVIVLVIGSLLAMYLRKAQMTSKTPNPTPYIVHQAEIPSDSSTTPG